MPSVITILAVIVGNILGYTLILNAMKAVYYTNYSMTIVPDISGLKEIED